MLSVSYLLGPLMTEDVLPTAISGGTITAPAGCGKTHLVAQSIASHSEQELPLLVLTHTNAGVAALRKRVEKLGVSPKKARGLRMAPGSFLISRRFPKNFSSVTSGDTLQ